MERERESDCERERDDYTYMYIQYAQYYVITVLLQLHYQITRACTEMCNMYNVECTCKMHYKLRATK